MQDVPDILIQLFHIQGPLKGQVQEFCAPVIAIGRNPACQVSFPRELGAVSRRHAEIVREGNRFKITDHSTNGTFVNGQRIQEAWLKDGDVLMFAEGGPKLSFLTKVGERPVFQAETPPPATASPPEAPAPPVASAPTVAPSPLAEVPQVACPLIIQYGPTLRSFRELPVTIGTGPCDFVVSHPALAQRQAQIYFAEGRYWVQDLSGRQAVLVNRVPVAGQAPLQINDLLALSADGPEFVFLGDGRLAEHEVPAAESPAERPKESPPTGDEAEKRRKGIGDLYRDLFHRD